jgi:type III pantothenate kinase
LKASFSLCGVTNSYLNPSQLGSDRWAALVAAWHIYRDACLVIIAGTAVTIDVLSRCGKFLGGIILPSKYLMLQSLHAGTQLNGTKLGIYEDFPVNTSDAIQTGVLHCLIGAIERMYQVFCKRVHLTTDSVNCIISGGGASSLIPYIKLPLLVIDNLVLEGLVIIAEDTLLNSDI